MKVYVGVDLGSTTTKALVLDEDCQILGKGITNSRSNYDTAAAVAKREALVDARFNLFRQALVDKDLLGDRLDVFFESVERHLRLEQFLVQLDDLEQTCTAHATGARFAGREKDVAQSLELVFAKLRGEAAGMFEPGAKRKSDFFRDIAGSRYMAIAEDIAKENDVPLDLLVNVYDRSIIEVENRVGNDALTDLTQRALDRTFAAMPETAEITADIRRAAEAVLAVDLDEAYVVGTGYGRARLPFSKEHIRSEILCHGLGAHVMYPATRTVLDIGGQDTKAIQVDGDGIVESFQMNDRCAAGCGRYLGYIADEMSIGLHELGPMAMQATRSVRINSTCTVFAGAELRDRLALGEKREDVLAGLHRAVVLRAMSIVSRSGGIRDEFTFTGGVANNAAAVKALGSLVQENFGDITINIHPNSIYTGALGAATFAQRAGEEGATA